MKNRPLWQKIAQFPLDAPGAAWPFSKKLEQEQGWDESYALRALAEYKKFLYLCLVLPDGASPSEAVDAVWHQHLTYTHNYWEDLCKNTLGKSLHHHPSKGGNEENSKHADWRRRTLEAYAREFGAPPPADIWDVPDNLDFSTCFSPDAPYQTLKLHFEYEALPPLTASWVFSAGVSAVAVLFFAFGNPYHLNGPDFLFFYFLLLICSLFFFQIHWQEFEERLQQAARFLPKKLPSSVVGTVLGGQARFANLQIMDFFAKNYLCATPDKARVQVQLPKNPSEADWNNPLFSTLETLEKPDVAPDFLLGCAKTPGEVAEKAVSVLREQPKPPVSRIGFWAAGLVLLVGVTRLFQGIWTHHSVGFLIAFLIVYAIGAAIFLIYTQQFKAALRKRVGETMRNVLPYDNEARHALQGFTRADLELSGLMVAALYVSDLPKEYSTSTGGDGGGCGGSGGDGGGGCGGCGGGGD